MNQQTRIICRAISFLILALSTSDPSANAASSEPIQRYKVEVMGLGDRKAYKVGKWSPDLCKAFDAVYGARPAVDAFTCNLPSPEPIGLIRPKWTNVRLDESSELLIEWTFWQYWKARLAHRDLPEQIQDVSERQIVQRIFDLWKSAPDVQADRVLRDPPKDVREAQRIVWMHYGAEVRSLIRTNKFRAQEAQFDLNRDGKTDKVYRITELNFEPYRVVKSRPKLRECSSQGFSRHATESIMVSEKDDPALARALWGYAGIYDVFAFKTHQYAVIRPGGWVQMGWVAKTSPSARYGIFLESTCQFNQHELKGIRGTRH